MSSDVKTGAEHIESLRDGRQVFLNGELVGDVTVHPAFRNSVSSAGMLYDYQARSECLERMTFESPTRPGRRVNKCWMLPRSYAELVERRQAIVEWLRLHGGWMGRSPDHLASSLVGHMVGIKVFEEHGKERAQAVRDYFQYVRDNDHFLTYVIINPQANRSKDWGEQADADLVAGVVDEDSEGITVRGAKMLGTSSIMANEVFAANIQPLKPGEERYAISFAVPMNAKGLKVLSRRSFEQLAVSEYDNPLSTHFDENDALMYFDDVKVPWERVFVYKDTEMCRRQFHDAGTHVFQNYQSQIRLLVKMQYLAGIAWKITETIGTNKMPPMVGELGHLAARAAMVEGLVYGMEAAGDHRFGEHFAPSRHLMYASQVLTQELYPMVINTIRELAGGSLIMLPSSARDFENPDLARIIEKTQLSDAMEPEARVKFLKLAWDSVGSEFASRHTQYEMFYAGAQFVTRAHAHRTFDWKNACALVDDIMGRYELSGSLGGAGGKPANKKGAA